MSRCGWMIRSDRQRTAQEQWHTSGIITSPTVPPCPKRIRKFTDLIKDIEKNPDGWELVLSVPEKATGKKWKGGQSVEYVYKNKKTGETIVKHVILNKNGSVRRTHYREGLSPHHLSATTDGP